MTNASEPGTSEKLLIAAEPLFAAKGFYGVSIREIAEHLNIAKSSLLHHFAAKEKLYAALLKKLAGEMTEEILEIRQREPNVTEQLKQFVRLLCNNSKVKPNRDMIILRELLDNPERAVRARKWFFADYFRELTDIIRSGQQAGVFKAVNPELFILHLLGAHRYFIISLPTMKRIFESDTYSRIQADHPSELEKFVEERLFVKHV